MNEEQKRYIAYLNSTKPNHIIIKKTGWESISLVEHRHRKTQIIYTLSGTLHIETAEGIFFVPEKHIAWIPQNATHRITSNSRQVSLVIFYSDIDKSELTDDKFSFGVYGTNSVIAENIRFIASSNNVISMSEQKDFYCFASSFLNIIPKIAPRLTFVLESRIIPDDSRLQPVLDYIKQHISEELTLDRTASLYGFSTRNLSRLFSESGLHFNNYVNRHRIIRAIELITDGGKTMQEIAYETGFNTPNHFNRVFKQVTGKSPKKYISE